jgi:hypothetical protein
MYTKSGMNCINYFELKYFNHLRMVGDLDEESEAELRYWRGSGFL